MTKRNAQIVQSTRYFHDQIGKACFGIAQDIFDDPTPFHSRQAVFNDNPARSQQVIDRLLSQA